MDSEAFSLQRMKLRAFDLSDRTLRRGEASAVRRIERWRQRAFLIVQCSVTAGISWLLARLLLGHQVPYFAAAAAILVLGVAYGQRLRRGVDVAIGVTLGVALGDIWLVLFGAGVWQVVLVSAIAMSLATLVGAGPLMTTQAGANSIAVLVMAPSPVYGFERWLDAVIGCTLALLVATVAPSGPLRKPAMVAAKVVAGMAETLDAAAAGLALNNEDAASAVLDQARAAEKDLAAFDAAAAEGLEVVRHSPFGVASCAWLPQWPIYTCHLTMPAATFGCWFGGVLSRCGGVITCRRPIKSSSDGSQKCADSSPGSWKHGGFRPPPGTNCERLVRPAHISNSPGPCQPS
jgi:uncharacterized membrane protein YgaE (UPF0421/DUF939 family)